jgi:hypothetical protein
VFQFFQESTAPLIGLLRQGFVLSGSERYLLLFGFLHFLSWLLGFASASFRLLRFDRRGLGIVDDDTRSWLLIVVLCADVPAFLASGERFVAC